MKRVTWLAVVLAGGLVLSGCASVPDARQADLPPGKIAVSDEQATAALDRFAEATAAANAEFSPEPLADMLAEPLLQTTTASLQLAEARAEEPVGPFLHAAVRGYSPRFTEYPTWFLSTSLVDNDPGRVSVHVMSREGPATEWIIEHSVGLGGVVLPEISENGEVTEPTDEQIASVDGVLQQVLAYLEGEDVEELDLSGFENYRDWVENSTIPIEQITDPAVTCAVDDRASVRSVATVEGVLGVALLTCTIAQQMRATVDATFRLGEPLAILAPGSGRRVEFVSSHPLVAAVGDDGTTEVYSGGWRWSNVDLHEERAEQPEDE